jgi:hypothetical protein
MSTATTLLTLITYLVCVSTVLGITFAGEVQQITIGQVQLVEQSQSTDFTNFNNLSQLQVIVESGGWNVSSTKGLYSLEISSGWWIFNRIEENTIIFTDLRSNDSIFTNTYNIQNPNLNDIDIILAYDASPLFFATDNPTQYEVTIRDEGIQYINAFYNTSKLENFNITTVFNFSSGIAQVFIEGTPIIDEGVNSLSLQYGEFYAGGVTAYGNDTRILSLSSYIVPPSIEEETSFSMSDFLNIIAMLFLWTLPNSILPFYLNVVFIKVPLLVVTFIII